MPVLTVKVPVVDPAVTVAVPGTDKLVNPLLVKLIVAPPLGAGLDSVTVQLLLALAPNVVRLQLSDEITVVAARFRFTLCVVPL
jgi:hypothetical protein